MVHPKHVLGEHVKPLSLVFDGSHCKQLVAKDLSYPVDTLQCLMPHNTHPIGPLHAMRLQENLRERWSDRAGVGERK